MWQVILGAAIAGSTGFVAKRLFNPFSRDSPTPENYAEEQEPVTPPVSIGFLDSPCDKTNGVFRFSSSGSTVNSGSGSGSSPGFRKSSGVKCRVRVRGLMKKKKKKNSGGCEIEKRSGNVGAFEMKSEVCSKKTKTLGAASASKHHSSFSSALGVCMMYMMSAEKGEISKLHAATEETTKVIQELKDELSRIKSLQGFKFRGCAASSEKSGQIDLNRSEMVSRVSLDIKSGNDGEYASSVLTEEPEQEAVEMEQLEMELESELQKLNLAETSDVMEECKDLVNGAESYQCGGISASELDKKLSHLLIEQQEGQINELEAELQTTQSKLQEKEAELQALKVCVRRLTEFPLLDRSDDEHEEDLNQDLSVSWSQHNKTDHEARKQIIGMKRPMEFVSSSHAKVVVCAN
ncbi:POLAR LOCALIZATION DURING ASYMMETRIC DIVISION AND protein [Arabidopsis thaliana]|uniref:POLAR LOCALIZATION DURING ASYMMETRIC DIVISION AND protein n=1 Tax=Arabidopsis thaliana TaxID=3702 RepID=F4J1A6_ARATH|nr:POLAR LOCALIZATION DURING ASYMMETRIC DIVISION AND protein [Arabidopsis thaliana]AEE74805.1 POLAR LOCALIZATION DURING ASYMMETRIC DIVISION AND protein [Arabidopsis thaliana]|eukprot:NP_001189849.1 POLAR LOCALIZATION DURING ASYMMETRIC DIVISION AND protein [Arabidopsis thaliana]